MKNYVVRLSAVVVCVVFGASYSCGADVLELKNGDRISGTLVSVGETTLTVETAYAGKIEVKLDAVNGVTTDSPRFILRKDGATVSGVLMHDGAQRLVGAAGATPFDLRCVKHIATDKAVLEQAVRGARRTWSGSVASGVAFRKGTKDTFDTTLDIAVLRKTPRHALNFKLNGAYGEADEVLNTQRAFGEAKWQVYPNRKRLYLFSLASGEHDKPRQLQLRTTLGAGLGYDFIKAERRSLSAEFGMDYAHETWRNYASGAYRAAQAAAWNASLLEVRALTAEMAANGLSPADLLAAPMLAYKLIVSDLKDKTREEDRWSARLSADFSQSLFKKAKLQDSLRILPSLDEFGEFRLTNSLAFTTPVTKSLDLRLHLQTEYDSAPGAADVDKIDNIFTAGVRWSF